MTFTAATHSIAKATVRRALLSSRLKRPSQLLPAASPARIYSTLPPHQPQRHQRSPARQRPGRHFPPRPEIQHLAQFSSGAPVALTPDQRSSALGKLGSRWEVPEGRDAIAKRFEFVDFAQAWKFMGRVAALSEEMGHHPEWCNVYNRVEVTLTTHDCNGLSANDVEMAAKMDEYESQLLSRPKEFLPCDANTKLFQR